MMENFLFCAEMRRYKDFCTKMQRSALALCGKSSRSAIVEKGLGFAKFSEFSMYIILELKRSEEASSRSVTAEKGHGRPVCLIKNKAYDFATHSVVIFVVASTAEQINQFAL
ncbi:hypothetical protein [Sporolactobacillus spathodeae]|uniref:Uncharacterized protein n=1 Tax=Sporolactobacillus spathodeae TaxID=1465502 RepID=A0ABS2Q4K3_9BACL|nr:hypothetical protein [Sporolactobacillus spathodeae]MBM7656714.1 hypothetical protein [Sporolactobacillus spathodeae]